MRLRVLVDATAIPADRGGVGRYVDELLPALLERDLDVVVAAQARDAADFDRRLPQAEVVGAAIPGRAGRAARLAWEQVGLPLLTRRVSAQVLHSPHYTMPAVSPVPVVVTVHDATFFTLPRLHSVGKRWYFRAAIRRAVRHASQIVVPSRATAEEVTRLLGEGAPFHVAHHGVDTSRFHEVSVEEQRRVAQSLGLDGRPYVAFVGTLEPRKNVPALVRGWVDAVAADPDPPALVLAGGAGWDASIDSVVHAVPAGLTVVRPGYLPIGDLAGFLAGAVLVAYPSLGEGFGLPVLEAMACGAAVLTSRELALPEVGGDAVAYCGTGWQAIGRGMRALLEDAGLRQRLSTAARERAATFTWAASAGVHERAYRAAVGR